MASDRSDAPVILDCRGVTVHFGGLAALEDVDLAVREGEIVGLIGPNGAGKTTLMECISGFRRVTSGRISYRGEDLLRLPASARAERGIGRTLQNVRLFPNFSVFDNLRIALHRHQSVGIASAAMRLPKMQAEEQETIDEAIRILGLIGMDSWGEKFASELSYGTLRLLEIGCMLALKPSVLLLDEPASGISQKETEALGPLLRDIKETTGATILMIEHDMPLVMGLSDYVYCLDAGMNLSEGSPAEVQDDPMVLSAYLGTTKKNEPVRPTENGRRRTPLRARAAADNREMLLEVSDLDVRFGKVQVLDHVDLEVRRGERVALLGTNGAGKSTILRAVSGLIPIAGGTVCWKGEDITG